MEILNDPILAILSVLVFLGLLLKLLKTLRVAPLSPVYFLIMFYLAIFVIGPFAYDPDYGGGGMEFYLPFRDELALVPQVLVLLSSLIIGVLIFSFFSAKSRYWTLGLKTFKPTLLSPPKMALVLLFAAFALVVEIAGEGVANLWLRHSYIVYANKLVKGVGSALLVASMPLLGLVNGQVGPGRGFKRAAVALFTLALIVFAALSTRNFSIAPVLFSFGRFIAYPTRKNGTRELLVMAMLTPVLMVFPLICRGQPDQGIAALPENLLATVGLGPETSFASQSGYHVILNNIFLAVPVTSESIRNYSGDNLHYLMTSISPLPSFATDFNEILEMLNPVTPMNAVGDLLRSGPVASILYFMFLGIYLGYMETNLRTGTKAGAIQLAQVGLILVFGIMSVQYPLRNVTRLVYYSMLIDISLRYFTFLAPKKTLVS